MNISCVHDANGNMISREDESGTSSSGQQVTISITATPVQAPAAGNTVLITAAPVMLTNCTDYTWDVENRLTAVTGGASFVYDSDGNRVKKTEGGVTILYVNKYYEKNITTGVVTTNYYLGGRLIATRENTTLTYVHQDALTGTSLTTNYSGSSTGSIKYFAFGLTRSGSVSTEQKFTGQRLDSTGLYYYGARYYDPAIGRFISADTIVPSPANPQSLNRYSYCLNNPLKYIDPTGHYVAWVYDEYYEETIAAWNMYKEIEPDKAAMLEKSDQLFTFGYGDANGGFGLTRTVNEPYQENGRWNFNTGTRIELNYNKDIIDPDRVGTEGIVTIMAHEVVHCTVIAQHLLDNVLYGYYPSQFEEIMALQHQYEVANKLGYSPGPGWRFWEYIFSTNMQNTYNRSKKAMGVDLSKGNSSEVQKQMDWAFSDSGYRMYPAWPASTTYFGILQKLTN